MVVKTRYALIIGMVLALSAGESVFPQSAHFGQSGQSGQSGSITGRVRERDGKVLEGVLVRASRATDEQQKVEVSSNQKGEFRLTALASGDYVLSFERSGFQTLTTRRLSVTAGETVRIRGVIELAPERPPFSIIRGAVFSADGLSLPNATVKIERVGEGKRLKRETVSAEGGEFAFRVPPEKAVYRVTATARGFAPATKEIEVEPDEVRQVALTLERAK